MSRAESWILEECEVDPFGRTLHCRTRNVDHLKVMQVEESVVFRSTDDGYVRSTAYTTTLTLTDQSISRHTLQTIDARVVSRFGWGLTKRIESYGLYSLKKNIQRVSLLVTRLHSFLADQ